MFGVEKKFSLNQTNRYDAIKICRHCKSNWQINTQKTATNVKSRARIFFAHSLLLFLLFSLFAVVLLIHAIWLSVTRLIFDVTWCGVVKSMVPPSYNMKCLCMCCNTNIPYFIDGVECHSERDVDDYITHFKSCAKISNWITSMHAIQQWYTDTEVYR